MDKKWWYILGGAAIGYLAVGTLTSQSASNTSGSSIALLGTIYDSVYNMGANFKSGSGSTASTASTGS